MINSFRRTGDGEADGGRGSGRGTGKRTEAAAAVRAVRLVGLHQRGRGQQNGRRRSAVRAAAALFPRMASGERSEAPTGTP